MSLSRNRDVLRLKAAVRHNMAYQENHGFQAWMENRIPRDGALQNHEDYLAKQQGPIPMPASMTFVPTSQLTAASVL